MARRSDSRSPSPVGSHHSSTRARRDDDRYARNRRDEPRSQRRRSRSRSPERRHRDRDWPRRRERSIERRGDRRDDDSYRPGRRDRSRDRRRSRDRGLGIERSPDRRRRRSRERDRPAPADSRRDDRRGHSRDAGSGKTAGVKGSEARRATSTTAQVEEDRIQAERLAKLEAWKKKLAEERERKQKEAEATGSPRSLARDSPSAASPSSPSVPIVDGTTPATTYSGKFDPKAIAKKATGASAATDALGKDVPLPGIAKASATLKPPATGLKADKSSAAGSRSSTGNQLHASLTLVGVPLMRPTTVAASALPKARGNVSGFGLGSKGHAEAEKSSNKRALDFGEEESTRKKLEKLPTPPFEDTNGIEDAGPADDVEDDDDVDMQDAGTEEETAAAARAAAEKREERLQSQNTAQQASETARPSGDGEQMTNGVDSPSEAAAPEEAKGVEEEAQAAKAAEPMVVDEADDVDPLDAFMSGLGDPMAAPKAVGGLRTSTSTSTSKKAKQQPEALFGDEDVNLDVMEADPDEILAMASKSRKKKDLPTVNHQKMNYEPFRKSFYSEPSEMRDMSEEELADLRLELDGIKIRGADAPKPVQKWSQCGLGVQTLEVIQRLGYDRPTSIQAQAIPAIMSGRDVIGVAKTGSGKTIAFLLPMFRHIKDQRPLDSLDGPVGLVVSPTRELATQIHKECKPFLKALGLRAVCAYGGAPIKDQIADLKRGAEIIVCTPGRIIDLLAANSGRVTNLRRVTYVVLDEADRMFDMGFEPQVMKIMANVRPDKQTILFSATFPRQMEALARKTLSKPVEIVVGGRSVVAPEITQLVEVRSEESKFHRLLELLGDLYDKDEDARTLIFVDRQESADGLLRDLMRKGYPCMSIHGGKDQVDRDSTIDDFKAGVVPIMIATSVAARGLDVKQLKLVVNFDAPNHLEDYVHRAGRTGRAGNTGTAVTFLTEDQERYSLDIAKALRQSSQPVPELVQKLVDSFIDKVKSGKEKASGSGFGGKGLERLDQERDAARNRERKTYKTGEEGEDDDKDDKKDDEIMVKAAVPVAQAASVSLPGVPKGIDLDGKITVHRTEVAASGTGSKNPLDRVGQAVADIHSRLNKTGELRQGVPIDNKGPDAGAFHATLEINDFPQKARWAVTNRTNVAKILEATGTSITTKGSFYAAGKEPQAGENAKLYILVEGDTEVVVTNAMRELMRLLKEGTMAAADSDARAPASGRYNVV